MNTFKHQRVLITGGLGFIGSNLAIKLHSLGARVTIIDAMIPSYGARLFNIDPYQDRMQINFSDIREPFSVDYLVADQDYIFCLAGQLSHLDSMKNPKNDLEINCLGHLNLLESCRRLNPEAKLVLTSTRQVYGRPQYVPVDELHPIEPVDINGIHKLAAEQYFQLYAKVYGLSVAILRLTNTYGPRMDLQSNDKGFTGIFIRKALLGETIHLYDGGSQLRDFNYIDDVCEALCLAAQTPLAPVAYNLGHRQAYSLSAFVNYLQDFLSFPVESLTFPADRKKIDIGSYYGSHEAFTKATGWVPQTDLSLGLAKTVKFYQQHARQYLPEFSASPTPSMENPS